VEGKAATQLFKALTVANDLAPTVPEPQLKQVVHELVVDMAQPMQ
jgi:hypothetical protein